MANIKAAKSLADLKSVRDDIVAREATRKAKEAALREQQRLAQLAANLFKHTVGEVQQVVDTGRVPPERLRGAPTPPIAHQRLKDEQAVMAESLSDEFDVTTLLETDGELSYRQPGIGMDVLRKLRKGEWSIQAQIDLHGLRREQARVAMAEFIRDSAKLGLRCVRVVHGKGLGSVGKEPVLKGKVRSWLVQKKEVIAFCQAKPSEGGAGALLVLLKPIGAA
jgi:DNA-nicking Smr family endonuclease